MKKQSRILFRSVSYSALLLTLSVGQAAADITINGGGTSGTDLEITNVTVSEATNEQKVVGTGADGDLLERLGGYYLGVEEDKKTYTGNIVVTDGANVTIAPYDIKIQGEAKDDADKTYNFTKGSSLTLDGTSSLYSQDGGRITIAPMRADEDSPVEGVSDITMSGNSSLLARGASAGGTSETSAGSLTISAGEFTLSDNAVIGGSYGIGRGFKDVGGTVSITGGTFNLSGNASVVQEGSANLTFSAEENGTGAVFDLTTENTGIRHSGGDGQYSDSGGDF